MHIQVQFNGETTAEIAEQMKAFMIAFGPPVDMSAPAAEKPSRKAKDKTNAAPATLVIAGANSAEASKTAAVDELLAKQQSDAKDEALATARELFAKGAEGQAKVREVAKHFEVKKLSEVPADKGFDLREKITDAQQELKAAESAPASDSIV